MAVKIHSGLFDKRIVFKTPVTTTNNEGGDVISYPSSTLTAWAFVEPVSEYRTQEASGETLVGAIRVYVWQSVASLAIRKDWLAVHDSNNYLVHEIEKVDDEKMFLKITLKRNK